MNETSKQEVKEVRSPIPMKAGEQECFDTEYERNGVLRHGMDGDMLR